MDTIARRDIRQLTMVLFTGGLVLLLFVLNYYYFIQIHSVANSTLKFIWRDAFPPPDLLGFASWFIEHSAGRIMAYPHGGGNYKSLLTTALVVTGIVVLWRQRRQFLLTLLVMPFLLTVMAAIFHAYPYGSSGRIAQHLAPSICILAAVGLAKVLEKIVKSKAKQNDYLRYACFVLLGFGLTGIGYTLAKPYKTIDDLEVRRIVTILLRDYECKRIYVPNRIAEVPVNFRWYLLVSERAAFNARIEEKTGNTDRTLCILYFDSNKFPARSSTLNKHLQTLTESFEVRLDVEKSIYIYGTQLYEHSYRQLVLQNPT